MTAGIARPRQKGAGTIEAGFIFLFLMGILFLLLDLCWGVFCKVSLQHAVREGCRYAITSQVQGGYGHLDSIKRVVRSNAMGFLSTDSDYAKIAVNFYRIDDLQQMTGTGSNAGGNLAVVSVESYSPAAGSPLALVNAVDVFGAGGRQAGGLSERYSTRPQQSTQPVGIGTGGSQPV